MFSDAYTDATALLNGHYLQVQHDPWSEDDRECMLHPGSLNPAWTARSQFLPPDDAAFEDELIQVVASIVRLITEAMVSRAALLAARSPEGTWVLMYAHVSDTCHYVYPVAPLLSASCTVTDNVTSAVYRFNASPSSRTDVGALTCAVVDACIHACVWGFHAEVHVQTTAGQIGEVATGKTLGPLEPQFSSKQVMQGTYMALTTRRDESPHLCILPVMSPSGSLFTILRTPTNPLLVSVYVQLNQDAMDATGQDLNANARAELQRMRSMLESAAQASTVSPSSHYESSGTQLLAVDNGHTLYSSLFGALQQLAAAPDVAAFAREFEETMDDSVLDPLVKAVVLQRARDVQQRCITQTMLLQRLASPTERLREMDGVCFDVLLRNGALRDTLPVEWQQDRFYSAGDAGFVSMLYLLQWRSTMERFVELARVAQFPNCIVPTTFRTGIVWDGSATTQSFHHVDDSGMHLFLFNPARASMMLCPDTAETSVEWRVDGSLQTQSAKARDTVVSFFIAHAVHLLAPLLVPQDPMRAALALHGMYTGALQTVDLRHSYKQWQRVVRELRQHVPIKKRRSP